MKKQDRVKRDADRVMSKILGITRHIRNVQDNCLLLGERLIKQGEIDLGHRLIANGFVHDASKFSGIEWENMAPGQTSQEEGAKFKLRMSIHHHTSVNPHHAEHWLGIENMPDVFLSEMCCDWKSRSEEFGTSLRDWIDNDATKRYRFEKDSKIYKRIMRFVDLLCEKPFEQVTP